MRLGLGWRRELGTSILANLDRIDVVEVIAEEHVHADANEIRALRFLARNVRVVVHATSLGLASTERVDRKRLDAVARVIGWIEPPMWSEHLAFVRAGGIEIGHLAAPPRNDATLEGLRRNLEIVRRAIGSLPLLENVATLVDPPGSTYTEAEWLRAVDADLLLDLHNLHANATNFGFDPCDVLATVTRVRAVHLAGGRRIEGGRILDDHLHAVPDEVYAMLPWVAGEDVDVILERDGNYPAFEDLLSELWSAATPVAALRAAATPPVLKAATGVAALQTLARIYTDDAALERFLANADDTVDKEGFILAARSFARKRMQRASH